jgi:tetratricopeptide (TPR) repeat protein
MEQLSASASELGWRNGELEASLRVDIKRESLWNEREGAEAKDKLQRSYGNQALVLKDLGRLEDAMVLHKKEESLCKELGDERSLQICYGNQALILRRMDKREEAMKFLKRQEDICLRLNDKYGLHLSYGNQALILTDWGRLEEALNLLKMMEPMCSELGNNGTLATNYGDQAEILVKLGRIKEAVHLLQQQETLSLELGARSTLGYCYWYWGRAYRAQGDHVAEKQKLQNALNIFIELEMPMEREQVRAEIANISTDSGE